ncbi:MAG: type II secretion system F family protein [Candidatus Nealsonbacteria bacterium]
MPKYFYTAKSLKGEDRSGTLEAKDKSELARVLRQEGYVLISASLEGEEIKRKKFKISLPFLGRVSLTEKMMFTKNLQVMIAAGISLPRALGILALQTKSKKFEKALFNVAEEITRGKSFSDSLQKHPDIFSELFISMVKVGEEAGTLEEVLKTLTQQMEREYELKSKIKGAMIYPAVIICAMIGIGFLMLVMVVPKLAETFRDLNVELPPTTKLVISFGTFLAEKWFFGILIVIGLFFVFRIILKTKRGKRMVDFLSLKIPIISPIIRKTNSAYTVRTLSSLFASGVPIVRTLEIVSAALGNIYFREAIAESAEKVRKGSKLSEALKPYQDIYPSIIIQMIEVGEETGETSEVLGKLADFFETEVGNATKNLSAVIEPVLMLIIGAMVGFFAISMIQPMYSMLGAI